jgi:hypothetical protein
MHVFASLGKTEDLERLVHLNPNLVHTPDRNMWLPLHEASRGLRSRI